MALTIETRPSQMRPITTGRLLGRAPHKSYLKRRLAKLGLLTIEDYIALAVARGCSHYDNQRAVRHVSEAELSNEELCAVLLSAANEYEPRAIRVAGQLLSNPKTNLKRLCRLVAMENNLESLQWIQKAGAETEPGNLFWRDLNTTIRKTQRLRGLPVNVLPHPSRFRVETGFLRHRKEQTIHKQWLRPIPQESLRR